MLPSVWSTFLWFKYILLLLFSLIVPEVSLETMFIEVNESDTIVSVCVLLKTNLKRDVTLYLDVFGYTATGENFMFQ